MVVNRWSSHTNQAKIQILSWVGAGSAAPAPKSLVSDMMTVCVLAATDSEVMQCGYLRFRGMPRVGSYVNNQCVHCRN